MDLSCIIQSGDLELYVMGMLPPEEAGKVEVLAQLFPEIQRELDVIAATFEAGAMQMAVTPSSAVKEKLMSSLPSKNQPSVNETSAKVVSMKTVAESRSSFSKLAIAASWGLLILLGGLSAYLFSNNSKLKTDVANLQKNTAGYEVQMIVLNKKLSSYETYRRLKTDASVTTVALATVKEGVKQQAEVFWNKATGELFIDPSLLPATPAGKQYQLWFILDGKPVDAGMISQADAAFIQKMKECKGAQAFAITLEKEGGNPTPQGDMVVLGKTS
ncbi:MAG: anti-sigma factor [Lacibacter sp.]